MLPKLYILCNYVVLIKLTVVFIDNLAIWFTKYLLLNNSF